MIGGVRHSDRKLLDGIREGLGTGLGELKGRGRTSPATAPHGETSGVQQTGKRVAGKVRNRISECLAGAAGRE